MRRETMMIGLWTVFIYLMLSTGAMAFKPIYSCVNETHLQISLDIEIGSQSFPIEQNDIYCPFGCEEGLSSYGADCSPSDLSTTIIGFAIVMAFIIIIFTLPYVLRERKKRGRG